MVSLSNSQLVSDGVVEFFLISYLNIRSEILWFNLLFLSFLIDLGRFLGDEGDGSTR